MNVPNALTLLRIFFVPILVAVLVQATQPVHINGVEIANEFLALGIFLVAAVTDLLDGYLARRWGQLTTGGTLLVLMSDKLLIFAMLFCLVKIKVKPVRLPLLIGGRYI